MTIRKKPVQKRSIEKYNYILQTGLNLIMKNGYYNTTTDDIAKAEGISTGIIYRYFSDKKEILIAAINNFIDAMEDNIFKVEEEGHSDNLKFTLETILDRFVKLYIKHKDMQKELEALKHSDKEINILCKRFDSLSYEYMKKALPDEVKQIDHLEERVYICVQLMENYCDFCLYFNF